MKKFPHEFSDFIADPNRSLKADPPLGTNGECVKWFPHIVDPMMAKKAIALLEQTLAPCMRIVNTPIPGELIAKLKHNFSESLPKTFHNCSVTFNSPGTVAVAVAKKICLLQMLSSKSLHRFAEEQSGYSLDREKGFQVIYYKAGDYVGPHNDHHPQDWNLRDGYIDLHITLTNQFVESQFFIYERNGLLNQMLDISISSGLTLSRLPYWHQVTPLIAKKGKEKQAKRWLLLVSFSILKDRPAPKKKRS